MLPCLGYPWHPCSPAQVPASCTHSALLRLQEGGCPGVCCTNPAAEAEELTQATCCVQAPSQPIHMGWLPMRSLHFVRAVRGRVPFHDCRRAARALLDTSSGPLLCPTARTSRVWSECPILSVRRRMAVRGIHDPHHPPEPAEPRDALLSGSGHCGAGVELNLAHAQGSPRANMEKRAHSAASQDYGGVFLSAQAFVQTLKWKIMLSCWKWLPS